jgi:hypothetical protein
MTLDPQPIAVTPTLFVGPNPPDVSGHFVHVTTFEDAAKILIERGMTEHRAWARISSIVNNTPYGMDDLFATPPGEDQMY